MNREILRLAIPNIISNLSVPLLSIVDVALMGHLDSAEYILTIGFGVMIFNFIYWSFGFLRMGTSGFTAQEYGKRDQRECLLILGRALLVALTGSLILIALKTPLLTLSLCIIDTTPEVKSHVGDYFAIRILAAPATMSLFAVTGWFFGMQNARYPMFLAITINLLNIGFSFWFVQDLGMKSNGVALGTLLAQYCGLIIALALFYKDYRHMLPSWNSSHLLDIDKMKRFLAVNSDIIIRTLCLMFVFSFFKVQSAKEGVVIGSANIILLELFMVIAFGIDGFANAAESIVGKYFGAKDERNFRYAIKRSFQWAMGLSILFVVVFYLFGRELLQIITDNQEVITAAIPFLGWIIISPIINTIPFIWDGIYIGITASKAMRNTMLISTFLFFLPTYYLLHTLLGNHALWLALTLLMFARGVSQTMLAKRAVFNRLK
ncbi:MAG: MATE family efflux transporter [Candidatus Scalindua sp. AMX11]|nr:MAG: MATE family efflux transporter [Candidatus Scalindua sp.]NOG86133.1 MATE family efflux transporter [Planctomycetota bacterium]RZV98895.1 MAG: MATE family efflux transporter [Candidatus Scalindua sp. SCAELEC01]TDE66913.1 MAG: MATE family efflux transporter [Candidatus Scalindua sp. AMX11]